MPGLLLTQSLSITKSDFQTSERAVSVVHSFGVWEKINWAGKGLNGFWISPQGFRCLNVAVRVPTVIACKRVSVSCSMLDLFASYNASRCLFLFFKYSGLAPASFFARSDRD